MLQPWWGTAKCPKLKHARLILERAGKLEAGILAGEGPLDRAVAQHQKILGGRMGSSDRAVLGLGVYGFARNRECIRMALPDAVAGEGKLLTLALLDAVDAPVGEGFDEFDKYLLALREIREQALGILLEGWESSAAEAPQALREAFRVYFSLPPYLLDLGPWRTLGEAALELAAGKLPQLPQLRVDRREERGAVLAALRSRGAEASPTALSPWGIVLQGRTGPNITKGLAAEFQDEGSQLAALTCLPLGKGAKVLDLCAGSGGKALALASASECMVCLYDKDRARLEKAGERISRSGRGNLARVRDPADSAPYDLVLVDAPCSSTGTLRRNPDLPWRWSREDLLRFNAAQTRLLDKAAGLVADGGLLVYVTCSLLPLENSQAIDAFLSKGGFVPDPPPLEPFPSLPHAGEGCFRLPLNLPAYHGDAFFCARLRKV